MFLLSILTHVTSCTKLDTLTELFKEYLYTPHESSFYKNKYQRQVNA